MPAALEGIRVIDMSLMLAGPMCAMNLADHGADVIKVEPAAGRGPSQGAADCPRGKCYLDDGEPQQAEHHA